MKKEYLFLILFASIFSVSEAQYKTEKPWTFWWWMGSAVSKQGIKFQLENFSKSGLGGVHIIPIYGVKGYEKQFIPFLSKEWIDMLDFTVVEGKKLGLGVDMTTGTGWPFGGPNVTSEMAAKKWQITDGQLVTEMTKQVVKRSALGGNGLVLDHFSEKSVEKYLIRFDSAFAGLKHKPRAMYSDSYEVFGANWTDNFLEEFKQRRGYDLQEKVTLLLDSTKNLNSTLIKIDYQETISDLLGDNFAKTWTNWSKKHGFLTRYQAHGSPANLLDLYNFSTIPETESFGSSRFSIPNLRVDEDYEVKTFGTPSPLAMKFASSPANFSGKKLVSSETSTWLANHFKVSLSQIKPQIDELFTAGVNHIFYHGTTYSPQAEGEESPGWLFYASTNYGLKSHFYKHLPLLNKYIENCQHLLQNSQPDNDILLYFPIYDIWENPAKNTASLTLLGVHVDKWILDLPFGKLTQQLLKQGFSLDYVSDKQLKKLIVLSNGSVFSGKTSYKTIIIPTCTFMPENTLKMLSKLAKQGAKIIFQNEFPKNVTGFNDNEKRSEFAKNIIKSTHRFVLSTDIVKTLQDAKIRQESWANLGLSFIRKKQNGHEIYFIANLKNDFNKGWIELSSNKKIFKKYNSLTNTFETIPTKKENGKTSHYLTLLSGQSCFLLPVKNKINPKIPKAFMAETLHRNWKVDFMEGKPKMNISTMISPATSWTTISDSAALFSGTAHYATSFDLPKNAQNSQDFLLDLGDVREVADVKINGKPIGTAWCLPFQVKIPRNVLKESKNLLEIEVTNLSANYMRLYDKQHPEWKKFYDANIVDIRYRPLDISTWKPMPSGLMSTVRLLYR